MTKTLNATNQMTFRPGSNRLLGAFAAALMTAGSFAIAGPAMADEGDCAGSNSRCNETRAEEEARLAKADADKAEAEARQREADARDSTPNRPQ